MPKINVTVQVESSADALGKALYDLVSTAKAAAADGWQPALDIPRVVAAAMGDVMAAISAIGQVPADVADDKVAFVQGLELQLAKVAQLFVA